MTALIIAVLALIVVIVVSLKQKEVKGQLSPMVAGEDKLIVQYDEQYNDEMYRWVGQLLAEEHCRKRVYMEQYAWEEITSARKVRRFAALYVALFAFGTIAMEDMEEEEEVLSARDVKVANRMKHATYDGTNPHRGRGRKDNRRYSYRNNMPCMEY